MTDFRILTDPADTPQRASALTAIDQVPARYRNLYPLPKAPEATHSPFEEWAYGEDQSRNLVVFGAVGTGKTQAAYTAARIRLAYRLANCRPDTTKDRHYTCGQFMCMSAVRLFSYLRDDRSDIRDFTSATLLLIDDMDARTIPQKEWLYDIVSVRYDDELPTIITTNHSPDTLKEAITEPTFDRLREGAVLQSLGGDSFRGGAA